MDNNENQAPPSSLEANANAAKTVASLQGVSIYQKGNCILKDLTLHIEKGEFIYLIGRTGTGKSSLLRTLYGDLPVQQGEGVVAGYHLKSLNWQNVPYLRRKLGIVFQDFQLLTDRNVESNLRFALEATEWKNPTEIAKRIKNVLSAVGMLHKQHAMPYQLSGGEQQRVVIARALLNDPALILADEPTGNLDPYTSDDIMRLLYQISRETDTAVLVGTHNYAALQRYIGRIWVCAGGTVHEISHQQMFPS